VVTQAGGQLVGMITQSSILNVLDPIELSENLETLQHLVEVRTASLAQEIKHHETTTQQLEKALTDLQIATASNTAKNEFLSHLSHELRTPLTSILGFTELLSTDLTLTEDNRHNLNIINRNSKDLLSLINNLLELSKIESGYLQLHCTTCDLWNLLQDMEGLFRLRSRAKQLTFILDRSPEFPRHIITDEKKLRQILINLLSNAIQFTNTGEVKLIAELQANDLSFQIVDTGPGIPESDRSLLFKPFAIAANPAQIHSGTGIGLAISQQFTEILGGQLRLLASSSDGSTFELRLPKSTVSDPFAATKQVFNARAWLIALQQAATHLNSYSCRQLLLEPPRSIDAVFLEVLSSRVNRFDFDRVVMLVEEKLGSF
jgi:two-component system, sensor histidine kinase and response regulator